MRGVLEQAEIHRHGVASSQADERGAKVDGPAKGPSEIAAGAQRKHPQHRGWIDRLSSLVESVDHFVERSVPAGRDDALISVLESARGYLRCVHRLGGELLAEF